MSTICAVAGPVPEEELSMTAYEMFVLAIAGANGGMFYYALRRREHVLAWIKARRR